ncbi:MAG: ABC transporter ATP-binding protein, partial [Dehalococcoidia bacterium]|nr:ABC transporter ATP-binding protein [Dehalococcoidia bacterium]
LSLEVAQGETLVILGPSGCGKTTVLRLIAGLEHPDEGTIDISGRRVAGGREWVPPEKRGVGLVFQDYALFPHLSLSQNIAFGLKGMKPAQRRQRVWEILFLVGLEGLGERHPHQLSGGQQQRVALGRALAPQPQVLLLDEPFSNLDTDLRLQVREEVRRILRTTGTTAIFVTHDQEEAFSLADRLAVLNEGRMEQLEKPDMVYNFPTTRFVADFVGHADFVTGEVTNGSVRTGLGAFPYQTDLPVGTPVEVMVRPDNLLLSPDPEGNTTVVERRFLGPFNQYVLRLSSGDFIHANAPSAVVYAEGIRLRAELRVACLTVFLDATASEVA